MTFEGWVYMNIAPSVKGSNEIVFAERDTTTSSTAYSMYVSHNTDRAEGSWKDGLGNTSFNGTNGATTTAAAWHYLVLRHDPTYSAGELTMCIDGGATTTFSADTAGSLFSSNGDLWFGTDAISGGDHLNGALDEIRFHNVARSDNYIATRYSNMKSPSTFWSVESEAGSVGTSTTNKTQTLTFSYDAIGNMTNKSGQGAYSYVDQIGTSYANPHAVTKIGNNVFTYDNSGNLTSAANVVIEIA